MMKNKTSISNCEKSFAMRIKQYREDKKKSIHRLLDNVRRVQRKQNTIDSPMLLAVKYGIEAAWRCSLTTSDRYS